MRMRLVVSVIALLFILAACAQQTPTAQAPAAPKAAAPTDVPKAAAPAAPTSAPQAAQPTTAAPAAAAKTGEPYKIGVIVAITGGASSLGVPERNTVQLLAEQINAKGGVKGPDGLMHPLQPIIYDTKSDETETVLATKKLIEEDKVPLIIGPTQSGETLAILDTVTKAEVPLISMAASIRIVEPVAERKWVFKTPQSDRLVIEAITNYLKTNNLTKVAWMSVSTGYGDGGKAEWDKLAPAAGLTTVTSERFNANDTDMTAQLTKIKGTDQQAVVVWSIPPSASVVSKNAYELGLKTVLFQSHGVANPDFIKIGTNEGVEGNLLYAGKLLVADQLPDNDPQKPIIVNYIKDYQAKFNTVPSPFGGYAYDALLIAAAAFEKAGTDRAKLRDATENTKGLASISGIFNMSPQDHNGLSPKDAVTLIEIKGGKWTAKK